MGAEVGVGSDEQACASVKKANTAHKDAVE